VLDRIERVQVTTTDEGPSGFQLQLSLGRTGLADLVDYQLLTLPVFRQFNRVILVVTLGGVPRVLSDGVITHRELSPGAGPGTGKLTITGEDISVMMDLEERSAEYPAQDETIIANRLILGYAPYGVVPTVIPPPVVDPPIPIERVPVQQGTDRAYLRQMADRFGYVFYVKAGPVPGVNTAYWGPPTRIGVPQRALSVNLGGHSNVTDLTFRTDGLGPTQVAGHLQDRLTNATMPVRSLVSLRLPLAAMPDWLVNQPNVRTKAFRDSGLSILQALARAQGAADATVDSVTATGKLDALRYGDVLAARELVGVRGAGWQHDGLYYVKKVTHTLTHGHYGQEFTLTRDGSGSITPVVRP
jgi:hypothetical protein